MITSTDGYLPLAVRRDAEESAHFGVALGTDVLRVKRVRTGNGEPLPVEHATLLASRAPEWPWPEGSLYVAMRQQDLVPVRVHQRYVPVLADEALATRLEVPLGSALMPVIRAGFAADDTPVEYSHRWFRPDRRTFAHEIGR